MTDHNKKPLATLHGWSLTLLYFSLVIWSVMITYALVKFDMLQLTGGRFLPWFVLLGCLATFASALKAGQKFWHAMRRKHSSPQIALMPFMAIAITIAVASQAFSEL